jgi:hypothetical protein
MSGSPRDKGSRGRRGRRGNGEPVSAAEPAAKTDFEQQDHSSKTSNQPGGGTMEKHSPVESNGMGLIGQWMTLSIDLATSAITTGFGILQDVRAEVSQRVESSIEFVSAWQQGNIRLAQSIHKRVDAFSKEALGAGEFALTGAVHGVKTTSEEAAKFASRTANVLIKAPSVN